MIPDELNFSIAGMNDSKRYKKRFGFWNNVYGYKMSVMREQFMTEASFDSIDTKDIITSTCTFKTFDFYKMKEKDLNFIAKYSLKARAKKKLNALAIWIDVGFTYDHSNSYLDGNPYNKDGTLKQFVFYQREEKELDNKMTVYGSLAFNSDNKDEFKIDAKISVNIDEIKHRNVQFYVVE